MELAQVYLKLGNPNAAQAELFAAHLRGVKDNATAPLMAQALMALGQYGNLLKDLPAGSRPSRIESLVRTYRGMAAAALNETQNARAMFTDAERLDPASPLPLIGEARLLMTEHQYDAAQRKAEAALKLEGPPSELELALRHVLIARSLERVGDNAVDIAEQAAFLATAQLPA